VSDNDNLAKWTAFARSTDPEAVGHMLNELAGEIGRLRGVCRLSSDYVCDIRGHTTPRSVEWTMLNNLAKDLANEGSKDGK
jgi:hypothetical protein